MNLYFGRLFFFALVVYSPFLLFGQTYLGFEYAPDLLVKTGNDTLDHAWGGGLNFVQVSDIDIDFDGDMDLFVFDRSGNEISVFEAVDVNGVMEYRYKYNGASLFPSNLRYRVALADYNQDGKNDLFTHGIGGISVYKNIGNAGTGLQWELAYNLLKSDYVGDYNNLYVSSGDIPAFVDVEGDGDLDVLTFHISGERLEYHQNQSMDLYGTADSLIFVLKNQCWGEFREDPNNNTILLNINAWPCGPGNGDIPDQQRAPQAGELNDEEKLPARHAGSTVLALDMDNNGVLDVVLGDVAHENLVLLMNGGTEPNTDSPMISQDVNFPSNTTPVSLQIFPAAFYVDVNHDEVKDLVVGANARSVSENQRSIFYYENLGTNTLPNFSYRTNAFLQEEMIDHGLGSVPVMFDQNGDGKRDLLVGNFFRYKPTLSKECALLVYRNTGTATDPVFSFYDDDFLGISTQILELRSIPAFGDVDGDGDEDMFLGLESGEIYVYTNTAGPGNPVAFTGPVILSDANSQPINVVAYSAPQLFDLDDDGLLDLIIGNKTGELAYYKNTGTSSTAVFTHVTDTLGGIDVATSTPDGYAIPHFFRVNDTTHLFLGAYDGKLHYYDQIDGHLHPDSVFNLVSPAYRGIDVGLYSAFWVEDIDNDGLLNLFVGQDRGGLFHMEADPNSTASVNENPVITREWTAAPNPTSALVTIQAKSPDLQAELEVWTIHGERILQTTCTGKMLIDLEDYAGGMYLIMIRHERGQEIIRVMKN